MAYPYSGYPGPTPTSAGQGVPTYPFPGPGQGPQQIGQLQPQVQPQRPQQYDLLQSPGASMPPPQKPNGTTPERDCLFRMEADLENALSCSFSPVQQTNVQRKQSAIR